MVGFGGLRPECIRPSKMGTKPDSLVSLSGKRVREKRVGVVPVAGSVVVTLVRL